MKKLFDYCAYGEATSDLNQNLADWGVNPISNGGNQPGFWRTLDFKEWNYRLST